MVCCLGDVLDCYYESVNARCGFKSRTSHFLALEMGDLLTGLLKNR